MRYVSPLFVLMATSAWGAATTPDGINSFAILSSGGGFLDGSGVVIGQAELTRSSKADFDSALLSASNTKPTGIYVQDAFGGVGIAGMNERTDEHATLVAQMMIGTGLLAGVSPMAQLHSMSVINIFDDDKNALLFNQLATLNVGSKVRAINFSAYAPLGFLESADGKSHFTQFVDWSARRHDVLYVVAWGNIEDDEFRKPQDNFNGITVAASDMVDGAGSYRKFSRHNAFETDSSDALAIDLLAPGDNIAALGWADIFMDEEVIGTSFAAPHVTGTAALLAQYAQDQINLSNPRFNRGVNPNSQRHETMKAVMMNSADKLAGVHGSTRDVIDNNDMNWLQSEAYSSPFIPLDDQMGAGHLNARRAVQQLSPGEYDPGPVEKIGWDYGLIGFGQSVEYVLPEVSGYIAITLAWDRIVNHTGGNTYNSGDQFFPYIDVDDVLNNLDIRLVGADGFVTFAESISPDQSLEHIFFNIQNAGVYRIVVQHNGGLGTDQNYALAWWNGDATNPPPGDYDKNGSVGPEDYDVWKSNFGTNFADADGNSDGTVNAADYTVWRNNFGAGAGSGSAGASPSPVPEPSGEILLVILAALVGRIRGDARA